MEFKKVFRGYNPKQVDKYIADTAERESATRRAQRERIEELSEENYNLRERIVELQRRQNDVSEALIIAQKVAADMEQNAKLSADKVLFEAKKFYATWQAYSKTIVASFTEDELAAFTALERKIGEVISNYERKLNGDEPAPDKTAVKKSAKPKKSAQDFVKQVEQSLEVLDAKSKEAEENAKTNKPANPITRVEQVSGQSVDIRELMRPEQSLEELCSDLGLIDADDSDVDGE